jgi:hypothetical protein
MSDSSGFPLKTDSYGFLCPVCGLHCCWEDGSHGQNDVVMCDVCAKKDWEPVERRLKIGRFSPANVERNRLAAVQAHRRDLTKRLTPGRRFC